MRNVGTQAVGLEGVRGSVSWFHMPKPHARPVLSKLTCLLLLLFQEDYSKASFLQCFKVSSNWQPKCIHTLYINSSSPSLVSPSGCIYRQYSHPCPAFIFLDSTSQALFICSLVIRVSISSIHLLHIFQTVLIFLEHDKLESCKVFYVSF